MRGFCLRLAPGLSVSLAIAMLYCAPAAAAPFTGQLLVQSQTPGSLNYRIVEYASDGSPVQTINPPQAPGSTDQWHPRDLVIGNDAIYLYNGTFDPYLSIYDSVSGTWSHRTHDGWSTINNASYGGIALFEDRVFVTNMSSSGQPSQGVVVFEISAGTSSTFAAGLSATDLNLGLDGKLWVLSAGAAHAFDPLTLASLGAVSIPDSDPRGIAADADGNLYVASWNSRLVKVSPAGASLGTLALPGSAMDVDVSASGQVAIGTRLDGTWLTDVNLAPAVQIESGRWQSFVAFVPPPAPSLLGDMNCDGLLTVSDIGGFVLALTDPSGYAAQFPDCDIDLADINNDGIVSVSDIGLFVGLLTAI